MAESPQVSESSGRARTPFALVLAADQGFALGLAVALYSALTNLSHGVAPEVYVLDNGLTAVSRARLSTVWRNAGGCGQLRCVEVPRRYLSHLAIPDQFTPATYARLLIPDLMPDYIQRVVYLDSDVLVKRDLSPLFTVDLGGAPFGAVRDFGIDSADQAGSGVRDPVPGRPYFNGGVLAIDVAAWRTTALGERALAYGAEARDPLPWADQDALNAVTVSWHELDHECNMQLARFLEAKSPPRREFSRYLYDHRRELYRNAIVLHFIGQKPWRGSCTTRGRMTWVRSLVASGWFTRREASVWLIRYLGQWARYSLGTLKAAITPRG